MLTKFIRQALASGVIIDNVYDIGACVGNWTKTMKQSALSNSNFYLFEGNPAYKDILAQSGYFNHIGVLSNPGREEVEFYNGTDTGDSYYKETTSHYDNKTSIKLPCRTLDSVIEEHNLPLPNFIKIDTQGSELDILSGGNLALSHADLVYLECPIIQYNAGSPNIGEYLSFLKDKKYIPVEVLEIHKAEGVVLQIDIMFMSKTAHDKMFGENVHVRPFE